MNFNHVYWHFKFNVSTVSLTVSKIFVFRDILSRFGHPSVLSCFGGFKESLNSCLSLLILSLHLLLSWKNFSFIISQGSFGSFSLLLSSSFSSQSLFYSGSFGGQSLFCSDSFSFSFDAGFFCSLSSSSLSLFFSDSSSFGFAGSFGSGAFTVLIFATANVAELIAASARHMVAAFILVHPVFASCATFCADWLCPLADRFVFLSDWVLDLFL